MTLGVQGQHIEGTTNTVISRVFTTQLIADYLVCVSSAKPEKNEAIIHAMMGVLNLQPFFCFTPHHSKGKVLHINYQACGFKG